MFVFLLMLFSQSIRVKLVQNSSTVERRFSSWIGGSILASLVSFHVGTRYMYIDITIVCTCTRVVLFPDALKNGTEGLISGEVQCRMLKNYN